MKTSFLFMLIFIVIILSTLVQPSIETMITGGYEDGMDNDNLNKEMQRQDAEDEQQEYDDDTGAPYANSYFTRNRDFNSGMVRGKDIEPGDEDLYILKSSVVPPVCPKCPDAKVCPRKKPCPPCPPCARCPEPAFTCKKVPNYQSKNSSDLPMPWLNSFSQFN
jgi:hypothetical protein